MGLQPIIDSINAVYLFETGALIVRFEVCVILLTSYGEGVVFSQATPIHGCCFYLNNECKANDVNKQ